jgi:hypothetical protein
MLFGSPTLTSTSAASPSPFTNSALTRCRRCGWSPNRPPRLSRASGWPCRRSDPCGVMPGCPPSARFDAAVAENARRSTWPLRRLGTRGAEASAHKALSLPLTSICF